jgi:flagellar biosynthetic protein FliR
MLSYEFALDRFIVFVMILIRIASFIYVAAIFNTANTPRRIKVGLAFFVAVIVYTTNPDLTLEYNGIIELSVIVLKEVVVGLLLGVITEFCVQIIFYAGTIIDMDTGLSMAQIMDPTTNIQAGIFGNLYYYVLLLLLLVTGLHRYLIQAIVETFKVIPLGGVVFTAGIYDTILGFVGDYFVIGFRIALPVFAVTLLLNVVLAILARVSPQMNMFVVGMQLKIFAGIFAVLFTIIMMPAVSTAIEQEIHTLLASLVRGMSP